MAEQSPSTKPGTGQKVGEFALKTAPVQLIGFIGALALSSPTLAIATGATLTATSIYGLRTGKF